MLGPPGPRVSGRKHPPPQLPGPCALDPGEQVSRTTNWKAASSKHLLELTSQEKTEGTVPWDPHASTLCYPTARTVRAPTPPALLRCYSEGWGQRPKAAGFDCDQHRLGGAGLRPPSPLMPEPPCPV